MPNITRRGAAGGQTADVETRVPVRNAVANLSKSTLKEESSSFMSKRPEAAQRIPRFAPCHIPERDLLPSPAAREGHSLGGRDGYRPGHIVFLLLFWNRFLGIRSGDGGFTGGVFFLKGILPYRDFMSGPAAVRAPQCGGRLRSSESCHRAQAFGVFERVILSFTFIRLAGSFLFV